MNGEEADICFTSPPYAQQRDYKTGPQDWDALMQGVFSILPVKLGAQVLVNLGLVHHDGEWAPYWTPWIEWMRSAGWRRFGWYVWDKGPGLPGDWNGRLAPSHEFIFHFNRTAVRARKTKDKLPESIKVMGGGIRRGAMRRKDGTMAARSNRAAGLQPTKIPDSVIRVLRINVGDNAGGTGHPAPFPVALVTEVLTAFCDAGAVCFEPFSGSGTQIVSAEENSRQCCAMEISPAYVDASVKRWSKFTGRSAMLADDGRTFDEVSAAREGGMTTEVECTCPECGAEFSAKPEGGHRLLCGDSTVATDEPGDWLSPSWP